MMAQPKSPSPAASQKQPEIKMTSQPSSPPHVASRLQTETARPSPSRKTSPSQGATQKASQPPSPSHTTPETKASSRAASRPPSPSLRIQTQSTPQSAYQTTSPSSPTSQRPPTAATSSQLSSPQPTPQTTPTTAKLPSPLSHPMSQGPEAEKPPKTVLQPRAQQQAISQDKSPAETTTRPTEGPKTPATLTSKFSEETSAHPPSSEATTVSILPPPETETKAEATKYVKTTQSSSEEKLEKMPTEKDREPKDKMDGERVSKVVSDKVTQPTTEMKDEEAERLKAIANDKDAAQKVSMVKTRKIAMPSLRGRSKEIEMNSRAPTSSAEQPALHKEIRDGVSRFVYNLTSAHQMKPGEVPAAYIVTLTGENRGASMSSGPRDSSVRIHRDYRLDKDETSDMTIEEEGSSRGRSTDMRRRTKMTTCINNNLQSINNSILLNSSCSERSPGVCLNLSNQAPANMKEKNGSETFSAQRADYNMTPVQQVTSQHVVKRRCLRGLFMESDESDEDNPQKPRRHGCRYSCAQEKKGRDESTSFATNGNGGNHNTKDAEGSK
ncbi:hypothetical protein ACLOJK_001788 [Asimina triloba]